MGAAPALFKALAMVADFLQKDDLSRMLILGRLLLKTWGKIEAKCTLIFIFVCLYLAGRPVAVLRQLH